MSHSTRFGGVRSDWKSFKMPNAAPTSVLEFIEPTEGTTMEVMLQLEGGVAHANLVVYRYAKIGDVEIIAQVSTATLTGDASDPTNHYASITHNGDRICATIQPQGGSDPSDTISGYRLL